MDTIESGSFIVSDGVLLSEMGEKVVKIMLIAVFYAEVVDD